MNLLKKPDFLQIGYVALYLFCLLPLFIELPFRPNLYLTWEGSYRISNGEIPFRDFGMPFGVGFWILPSLLFALFGPYFKVLVLAQVIINILSLVVVKNILKELKLNAHYAFLLVVIFYSTMCLPNYWPWYNHVAVIYQLASVLFLLKMLNTDTRKAVVLHGALSTFFISLSFFTKQDIGALGLLINLVLVLVHSFINRNWKYTVVYGGGVLAFFLLNILPFVSYEFGYWFNHGQAPHSSRLRISDIFNELITGSEWIKFYLLVIVIILIRKGFFVSEYIAEQKNIVLALLALGILAQATIIQFTSFNPPNGNIYFHIFALAFILLNVDLNIAIQKTRIFIPILALTLLWWSFNYHKYTEKVMDKILPSSGPKERLPNTKYTWQVSTDTMVVKPFNMTSTDIKVLKGVTIPRETWEGIQQLKALDVVRERGSELKVLNMSELTFLAHELPYPTLKGSDQPLWYHLHVNFFEREIEKFCREISENKFDLVLFQDVYYSDNYFPYAVKDCVLANSGYEQVTTIRGPKGFPGNYIHVYVKK